MSENAYCGATVAVADATDANPADVPRTIAALTKVTRPLRKLERISLPPSIRGAEAETPVSRCDGSLRWLRASPPHLETRNRPAPPRRPPASPSRPTAGPGEEAR